jgi:hypothetical protein
LAPAKKHGNNAQGGRADGVPHRCPLECGQCHYRTFLAGNQAAAQALGVELSVLEVRTPNDFEGAFAATTSSRAEALIVMPDAFLADHRARIVDLAQQHRLPGIYPDREYVDAGGLMGYTATQLAAPIVKRRCHTGLKDINDSFQ